MNSRNGSTAVRACCLTMVKQLVGMYTCIPTPLMKATLCQLCGQAKRPETGLRCLMLGLLGRSSDVGAVGGISYCGIRHRYRAEIKSGFWPPCSDIRSPFFLAGAVESLPAAFGKFVMMENSTDPSVSLRLSLSKCAYARNKGRNLTSSYHYHMMLIT